jgi:hypothetical protein
MNPCLVDREDGMRFRGAHFLDRNVRGPLAQTA